MQEDDSWSWLNSSTITVTAALGTEVELRRITPYDPMVTFTNASLLNQDDQNMAALQAIYLIEEGVSFSEVGFEQTRTYAVTFVIEGGGVPVIAGDKGFILIPMACTINAAYLLADVSGTIECDIWAAPYSDYPPTAADSITGATPLIITNDNKTLDTTLTGWNTLLARNGIIGFSITSNDNITRLTVVLIVTVTS